MFECWAFNVWLNSTMKKHGISQADLARYLRKPQYTLSSWQTGKNRPNVVNCALLAKAFGKPVNRVRMLAGWHPEPNGRVFSKPAIVEWLAAQNRQLHTFCQCGEPVPADASGNAGKCAWCARNWRAMIRWRSLRLVWMAIYGTGALSHGPSTLR